MWHVAPGAIARRKAPRVRTIPLVMLRILDAVSAIDQRQMAIVFEVIRKPIANPAGIKSHVRIMGKEKRISLFGANLQFDSIKSLAVEEVVVLRSVSGAVGPARVVKAHWHSVRGRSDGKQVDDHHFVEPGEAMIDVPGPFRRPVPVERVTLWRLAIPIPLHGFPELRNAIV